MCVSFSLLILCYGLLAVLGKSVTQRKDGKDSKYNDLRE